MTQPTKESQNLATFAPALILLVICFLINYVDRGNISIAAPLLKKEFGLTESQLGVLFATFFVTYTAGQFVVGWLVDRFEVTRILAAGFLVWSLATAATGVVRGFGMLLAMRLVLGAGEAVAMPSGSKILAQQLAEHHRGFASGALMFGLRCGNALGTLCAGMLMAKFGWRPVFLWVGLISLLWLPAWRKWKPRPSDTLKATRTDGPEFAEILRQRSFWGTSTGHFCANYILYFMVTWLPSYLVQERHLSMGGMAKIAGLYYFIDAVSALAGGWLQDVVIRRGHTPTAVRKSAMALSTVLAAAGIAGCAVAGPESYLCWLMVAGMGCGGLSPGLFTFPQALAGEGAVGKWYGWQNGFGNFAGVICPALTGFVLEGRGNFLMPFAVTGATALVGGIAWVFVVGRLEPVKWRVKEPAVLAKASADD
jgi:ACS family D-galactonate transporter-like MFS transporter